jgi:hypothetical protein
VGPIRNVEPQIPDPTANDDSRAGLQAAARNYKLVKISGATAKHCTTACTSARIELAIMAGCAFDVLASLR